MTESSRWLLIRMDMLKRLLGPWGKGASKQTKQGWLREYHELSRKEDELNRMLVEEGNAGRRDN